jgi:hypothetical protein
MADWSPPEINSSKEVATAAPKSSDWAPPEIGQITSKKEKAQSSGMKTTTDVLNRGLVASTLGAPVDIATMAMRPFGYKEKEPVGGSEWIGSQMQKAGMVSPTRRPGLELAAGLAPSLVTGGAYAIPKMARSVAGTAERLMPGAVEKGKKLLSTIAPSTDVSTLGAQMESTLNQALKSTQTTRSTDYNTLMTQAGKEAAGKESRILDNYTKYVKKELIGKPQDLNDAEQKLLAESVQAVRGKSLVAMEKELRRLKDIAEETKLAPGYSAVRSSKAKEMARELEKSIDLIAPSAKKARTGYREASEPVNIYESMLGRKALEGEKDPAKLPDLFFKTKYTTDRLKTLIGEQNATKFANSHIANELQPLQTAKQARAWVDKNKVWLEEFPQSYRATENYVKNLEQIEKTRTRAKTSALGVLGAAGAKSAYDQLRQILGGF